MKKLINILSTCVVIFSLVMCVSADDIINEEDAHKSEQSRGHKSVWNGFRKTSHKSIWIRKYLWKIILYCHAKWECDFIFEIQFQQF